MKLPVGTRFGPEDLGLVRLYLRNKVENNQSSFITTMDVYKDEPWLLPHVSNPLFKNKEWYYFVPKPKRGVRGLSRTVPGREGSEGGVWHTNGKKDKIFDGEEKVMGYMRSLTYHTKVCGKSVTTKWLMTEYSLHEKDDLNDLFLCRIREKEKTEVNKSGVINLVPRTQAQPQVAENNNNILPNQIVQEEHGLKGFAVELEKMLVEGQEDAQIHDNNNVMITNNGNVDDDMWNQDDLFDIEELLKDIKDKDVTEHQQKQHQVQFHMLQPISQAQDPSQLVGQDDMMVLIDNPNNSLALGNYELLEHDQRWGS